MGHAPPPDSEASIDNEEETVELTQGSALAIECTIDGMGPCENVEVRTIGSETARVYRVHYGDLQDPQYGLESFSQHGFVVTGLQTGVTELEVQTSDASRTYELKVLP